MRMLPWRFFTLFLTLLVALVQFFGSPAVAQGRGDWWMYQHDPQHTGCSPFTGPSTPWCKWAFPQGGSTDQYYSPTIGADGTLYVGSDNSGLFALNPDGTQKWVFPRAGGWAAPAIGSDGTIYADNYNGGNFIAINPDGTLKWAISSADFIWSPPTIGMDGTIYVGCGDQYFYAIAPDGTIKWRFHTGGMIWSSPAIGSDGTLYFGSGDHCLYALNPNGTMKWAFQTGDEIVSSPIIGPHGTVYIGSEDRNLYAITPNGTLKWVFPVGGAFLCSSPAVWKDDTIYVRANNTLYAINPNGTQKWAVGSEGEYSYSTPSIGADGTIYIIDGYGTLNAIRPNGTRLWQYSTGNATPYSSAPTISADGTLFVGGGGNLFAIENLPLLPLTKSANMMNAAPGYPITYYLTYSNTGAASATNVVITDSLPTDLTYVPGSADGGGTYTSAANTLTWALPTLAPGQWGQITFRATIASQTAIGSTIKNTATIRSTQTPVPLTSNTAVVTVASPMLTLAKSVYNSANSATNVQYTAPGTPLTYTLAYGNTGTASATNLVLTDALPNDISYVPGSADGGGSYEPASRTITWPMPALAPGMFGQVSFQATIDGTATSGSTINNTASITSAETPIPLASNTASVTVAPPVLSVLKSIYSTASSAINVSSAGQGATIEYFLLCGNSGSSSATNLVLTDTLPAGITYVPDSASSSGAYNADTRTLSWSLGTLGPGQSELVIFQATVDDDAPLGSTITNTAMISSTEIPVPVPSNAATFTVLPPRCTDLLADVDFTNGYRFTTDSSLWNMDNWGWRQPPAYWSASPSQGNFFDMFCWYGWGVESFSAPASFNMMSTVFTAEQSDSWGVASTSAPLTVQRELHLPTAMPITGWGLTMRLDLNNIVNTQAETDFTQFQADPRIALEDGSGKTLANLEWKVTPGVTPDDQAGVSGQVLLNGVPVTPVFTGIATATTGWMNGYGWFAHTANFPGMSWYTEGTNQYFDLVLAGGADGHAVSRIISSGPNGTVIAPALGGASGLPARLAFYCGNGMSPQGGGNFQIYYQPTGTMNFYYTHALPMDDSYQTNQDTLLTINAPGVLGNDQNPDNAGITAELATPPAHGTVGLNPDGSFTYVPAAGYTGPDSFTYHLLDGPAVTSTATVHLQVRTLDTVRADYKSAGTSAQVFITLLAQGDENTLGFTLNYDATLLSNPRVALGADAATGGALLMANTLTPGQVGMGIALPAGQTYAAGARQLAVITFAAVNAPQTPACAISFGDTPAKRELVDVNVRVIGATWTVYHAPVGVADAYSLNENAKLNVACPGVLANDTDVDGDTGTARLVTAAAHGKVQLHPDGSFTYTPAHNFVGTDTFTYQSGNGIVFSDPTPVTLTVIPTGLEADVTPRDTGDGQVTMADWVQVGRFVASVDTPASPSEYQRADCAPRATQGDGLLTVADWVQAGRYAVGLDPLTPAGGPTAPTGSHVSRYQAASKTPVLRTVSLAPTTLTRGKPGAVQVVLTAQGNESALGFTLNFDPKQVKFLGAKLVGAASNATLNVNTVQAASGRVGLALMLPLPQTVKAGKQALVELVFQPLAFGPAALTFGDQCVTREVAGSAANALPATFVNGTVMVRK